MKTKFFFLLAAMLLSVSAFAQSGNNEPLKGDVNGDGTVDVADIAAIIEIMKNGGGTGEQTIYYWYVGQTQPTSMTSVTAQDSGTFTNNNWHTINVNNTYTFGNPIYNSESNPITGDSNTNWYVALPADKSYSIYDSDDVNEVTVENITKLSSTITVKNVTYNIYKTVGTYRKFNGWWIH